MKMIVAMDPTGIIGVNGAMPWHYKADFKRFKKVTMGGTLVMGRKTWESLPGPLPGRRTIVLTRDTSYHGAPEVYTGLDAAILAAGSDQHGFFGDVWVCGGEEIYKLFLEQSCTDIDVVDVTFVPAVTPHQGAAVARFPVNLLEERFTVSKEWRNEDDPRLTHRLYVRK